jgi:putative membrane protein
MLIGESRMEILLAWLVTTIGLLIISRLPLGVEIDGFQKAAFSAIVFGILNALVLPIIRILAFPITLLTLGLFSFVLNAIIFGLAALLVSGFHLRWGFLSALLGSIALGIVNSVLYSVLGIF